MPPEVSVMLAAEGYDIEIWPARDGRFRTSRHFIGPDAARFQALDCAATPVPPFHFAKGSNSVVDI